MADDPPAPPTAIAAQPASQRALSRLRAIAAGNGVAPDRIALRNSDEATYRLTGELLLTAQREVKPLPAKAARGQAATRLDSMDALAARSRAPLPSRWVQEARSELDNLPGQGWGLHEKRIVLAPYNATYRVDVDCDACRGKSHAGCSNCHGRGRVTCPTCHGAGRNPQHQGEPCPRCQGRNQIDCSMCNGTGKRLCAPCQGRGKVAQHFRERLVVDTAFRWADSGVELPTALRRSVDRAGLAKLANGHATIARADAKDALPSGNVVAVRYTADLPFAAVKFEIEGRAHRALVLGHKGAVLELTPFLDGAVEQRLAADDAQTLRAFGEAQRAAARGQKPAELLRLYPVGLSAPVAGKLWKRACRSLYQATHRRRWAALAIGTGLSIALIYGWFAFDWRAAPIRWTRQPVQVDLALPLLLSVFTIVVANAVERRELRRIFGVPDPKSRRWQWDIAPALLTIAAAFALYVLYGAAGPEWYAQLKVNAQIERLTRTLDPPLPR